MVAASYHKKHLDILGVVFRRHCLSFLVWVLIIMARTNPITFLRQVRSEISKVVWPTRRETLVTTLMTLIFVFITAIFFLVIDQGLSYVTGYLFG